MKFFNTMFGKFSIRHKILFLVVISVVGFAVYFALNFSVASSNATRLTQLSQSIYPTLEGSEKNLIYLDKIIASLDDAVATEEEEEIEAAEATEQQMQGIFSKIIDLAPAQAERTKALQAALSQYFAVAKTLTMDMMAGEIAPDQIASRVEQMQITLNKFRTELSQFRDEQYLAFNNAVTTTNETLQFSLGFGAAIGVLLIVVLAAIGYFVASNITGAIKNVSLNLQKIASGDGDLTLRLTARSEDEVGELVNYFNTFMNKLQGIIQDLKGHSEHVGKAADDLAKIAQHSLDGMERQQKDTEQVAAASKEMASTVGEVTQSAGQAAEAADTANTAATEGSDVVNETIAIINALAKDVEHGGSAVNRLREDSENVSTVLDVIRGIAEQTNLLALNAAIEAARAGEHGRGFAVVADEVRTLASRTQESTQEIQEMIERLQNSAEQATSIMDHSKQTSEQGVEKAANAGDALQNIAQSVSFINTMNAQIASAADKQSAVAVSMDSNIMSISQATEENTENSNKLAHAGVSLSQVATQLQQVVGQFKV